MPFRKVLVANRGEIASRVIRTLRRLGILSVAVFSDADATAPYVGEADEAVAIGPARAQESYLNADRILEAARSTGADAIHPGYGFLSENPDFAARCRQEGVVFVGPRPEVTALTGLKSRARVRMAEAGLPVLPGSAGLLDGLAAALAAAEDVGYPVMLKATAGGGGVGLKVARKPADVESAFVDLSKRAQAWFKDGGIYLEKLVEGARHVEVQVVADSHGNVFHLFDRECSAQRRHQKVVEEALSPAAVPEDARRSLWECAVRGAKEVGYDSVGTFEFLLAPDGQFYFMEMNARLQVEHPATEAVTGLDIVQLQLEVAAGGSLDPASFPRRPHGHAIEARVYAEDPSRGFRPSPGTIEALRVPEMEGIRHEVGVRAGYTVTPFYDPLLAKVIAWGTSRDEAMDRLVQALERYEVKGIQTNIALLLGILADPAFRSGQYDTRLLDEPARLLGREMEKQHRKREAVP